MELGWHFDNSSFAVTMMLQAAEGGAHFEHVPRSATPTPATRPLNESPRFSTAMRVSVRGHDEPGAVERARSAPRSRPSGGRWLPRCVAAPRPHRPGSVRGPQQSPNAAFVFASTYQAPVIVNIVNNYWAISTPEDFARGASATVADGGFGFSIPALRVDGNDSSLCSQRRSALPGGPVRISGRPRSNGSHCVSGRTRRLTTRRGTVPRTRPRSSRSATRSSGSASTSGESQTPRSRPDPPRHFGPASHRTSAQHDTRHGQATPIALPGDVAQPKRTGAVSGPGIAA
jgi:hypothetical protein